MTKDSLLQVLILAVNDDPDTAKVPITLCVGGTLISGLMVSEREYFEEISSLFQSDDDTDTVQNAIRRIPARTDEAVMRMMDEDEEPNDAADVRERLLTEYVHLQDTRVETQSGSGEIVGALWRGKTEAIEGFWLGTQLLGSQQVR